MLAAVSGQEVECYKAVAGESEYYVRKDVAERYLADAYDFSEWFIDLTEKPGRSKGIICDKKNVYEGLELKEELERVIQGNYTQGDFKILLGYDNSSAELRRIRGALRSVVCRHPLEWDESQFASESLAEDYRMVNRQTAVLSRAQARNLRKAAADIDIWRGGLERVFGRNEFNFYHPLYFLHYLDKAGFLEFNPYAGKRYKELYNTANGVLVGIDMATKVIDTPGFVPVYNVKHEKNIDGWAGTNGFFNQDYGDIHEKWSVYFHEGVDFAGIKGTPIKSLIYGEVIDLGTHKNTHSTGTGMGDYMIVRDGTDKNKYFLLLHLNWKSWEKYGVTVGSKVNPGMTVAEVGTQEYATQYHLHVSVIVLSAGEHPIPYKDKNTQEIKDGIIRDSIYTFPIWIYRNRNKMRNPFNHQEEWKGRY